MCKFKKIFTTENTEITEGIEMARVAAPGEKLKCDSNRSFVCSVSVLSVSSVVQSALMSLYSIDQIRNRLSPSVNCKTLKLIKRPTGQAESLRYDRS